MTKQSGLGDNLYVGGFDLSGDVGEITEISGGPTAYDVTGINKSARERIGGLRDAHITFKSFFNDAAGQEHLALRPLPRTDVDVMYLRGTSGTPPAASIRAKQLDYRNTRGADGALTWDLDMPGNAFGLEWGQAFTSKVTETTPTGHVVDTGAPGTNGWQCYLQVFAFAGAGPAQLLLNSSSDNGVGDPYALMSVSANFSSAPFVDRFVGVGAHERYISGAITGTYTSCTWAAMFISNATPVVF